MSVNRVNEIREQLGYLTEYGLKWLKIDIANTYGLDKKLFDERIKWVEDNDLFLEQEATNADSPWEYRNAVKALREHQNGKHVEHMMYLDCTNQALQLFAVLTSCKDTGYLCNVSSGDILTDAYGVVADEMNKISKLDLFDRNNCKKALMTTLYGKMDGESEIILYLNEKGIKYQDKISDDEIGRIFQDAMKHVAPNAMKAMDKLQALNSQERGVYYWKLTDGFQVKYDVKSNEKIEIDAVTNSGVKFKFERDVEVYKPNKFNRGMAPNIIHSIDGYVAREMIRRMRANNPMFSRYYPAFITTIHDAFATHPNNVEELRMHYTDILCELNEQDILQDIMSQIEGKPMYSIKRNTLTEQDIRSSVYSLS